MGESEQEEALSHDAGTRREEGGITSEEKEIMTYLYQEPPAPIISADPHPSLFTMKPTNDPTRKDQIADLIRQNCPEKCAENNRANVWQRFAKGLEAIKP